MYAGVNQYVTLFYSIWGGQRHTDNAIFVLSSAIVTNTGETIYNSFTFMWKVNLDFNIIIFNTGRAGPRLYSKVWAMLSIFDSN
jgi:hypothetical protein